MAVSIRILSQTLEYLIDHPASTVTAVAQNRGWSRSAAAARLLALVELGHARRAEEMMVSNQPGYVYYATARNVDVLRKSAESRRGVTSNTDPNRPVTPCPDAPSMSTAWRRPNGSS